MYALSSMKSFLDEYTWVLSKLYYNSFDEFM